MSKKNRTLQSEMTGNQQDNTKLSKILGALLDEIKPKLEPPQNEQNTLMRDKEIRECIQKIEEAQKIYADRHEENEPGTPERIKCYHMDLEIKGLKKNLETKLFSTQLNKSTVRTQHRPGCIQAARRTAKENSDSGKKSKRYEKAKRSLTKKVDELNQEIKRLNGQLKKIDNGPSREKLEDRLKLKTDKRNAIKSFFKNPNPKNLSKVEAVGKGKLRNESHRVCKLVLKELDSKKLHVERTQDYSASSENHGMRLG